MMSVVIEPPYTLRSEGKTLRLEVNGELIRRIPYYQIDSLMIRGKVDLNAEVFRQCAAHGVPTLLVGARQHEGGSWVVGAAPPSVMLRVAQHRATAEPAAHQQLVRALVQAKFNGYRIALNQPVFSRGPALDRSTFLEGLQARERQLQASRDSDEARGLEGTMAREWFRLMGQQLQSSWGFSGRNRQPPKDPVNALLSLTYTILLADVQSALTLRGLDVGVGFLHVPTPGRASLALDLLEPLRPLADAWVLSLCQQVLMPEHFTRESSRARYLSKGGRSLYYPALANWRQQFATHLTLEQTPELWPAVALPQALDSLGDLCRHLAHQIAGMLLRVMRVDEAETPNPVFEPDDEQAVER
ncbi:MAG: CRISPR-associated endonuclease Cas1 [Hahellaceae bacterium]|nr:CRISPR-associated endonuclease Cas1 [Hahellaceae bacterium]